MVQRILHQLCTMKEPTGSGSCLPFIMALRRWWPFVTGTGPLDKPQDHPHDITDCRWVGIGFRIFLKGSNLLILSMLGVGPPGRASWPCHMRFLPDHCLRTSWEPIWESSISSLSYRRSWLPRSWDFCEDHCRWSSDLCPHPWRMFAFHRSPAGAFRK